jgi:protein O-GlcNAc transferase
MEDRADQAGLDERPVQAAMSQSPYNPASEVDSDAAQIMPSSTQQIFDEAVTHHRAGRRGEAMAFYQQVISSQPDHAGALRLLGSLESDAGRHDVALALINRAIAVSPDDVECYVTLGRVLAATGHGEQAIAAYRRAIQLRPDAVHAQYNLGNLLMRLGRGDEAIASFRSAIASQPQFAEAHHNLAAALARAGRLPEAIEAYRQTLAIRPEFAEAANNLGISLRIAGQIDDAIAAFRQAIRIRPQFVEALRNLGDALTQKGSYDEAMAVCRQALVVRPRDAATLLILGNAQFGNGQIEDAIATLRQSLAIDPKFPEALNSLANALWHDGNDEEAIAACNRAIELRPDYAEAHSNLSMALWRRGRFPEAAAAARRAIELKPLLAEAHINLGIVLKEQGLVDESVACFRRAATLRPGSATVHLNLAQGLKDQGLVEESLAESRKALECDPRCVAAASDLAYAMHFHPADDAQAILKDCRAFNRLFADAIAGGIRPHGNDTNPDRRLRVGYVGADFRQHCQAWFLVPLLSAHDHAQVEVHCYSSVARPDAMTDRLRGCTDAWHDVAGLSDVRLAEMIRSDAIDVLIDLTMHMGGGRPLMFARKPAPVQVAWLAYPGTTGIAAMDYRLTDPYLDPPGEHDGDYSEQSIRLPDTFWVYDPRAREIGDPHFPALEVNALPALATGHITFGCLNNFCKVTDRTLQMWASVLNAVADSRLIMMAPPGSSRQRILETLVRLGVAANRIEFVGFQANAPYMRTYQRIDLALDTFPYNGHTTSLDSYWMGLPVVTLVGHTAVARAGWSQLNNLGLTDLAAQSAEQFVRIAMQLAGDIPQLSLLRCTLRERLQKSPLMDASRFARNLETAYRQMWQTWCARQTRPTPRP